jgi:hypothetical protein
LIETEIKAGKRRMLESQYNLKERPFMWLGDNRSRNTKSKSSYSALAKKIDYPTDIARLKASNLNKTNTSV